MTPRRQLQLALVLCLGGATLVLVGVSRPWVSVEQTDRLTIDSVRRAFAGTAFVPGLRALGYVALAGVVAMAATRRTGRVLVGALLVVAGAAAVWLAGTYLDHQRMFDEASRQGHLCVANGVICSSPPGVRLDRLVAHDLPLWLTIVGGAAVVAGGALTVLRGRTWAGLGSAYEAPGGTAPEPVTEKGVWDALDRGDDPTA